MDKAQESLINDGVFPTPPKKFPVGLIIGGIVLVLLGVFGGMLAGKFIPVLEAPIDKKAVICGGWDTSGETQCECSGSLNKPTCPDGAICDGGSYTCEGSCGNCCYKGIGKDSKYPPCEDKETASQKEEPKVAISTVSARCQDGEKLSGGIFPSKGLVAFSGTITNASPCGRAYASIRQNDSSTDIIVRAMQITTVVCIECVGVIDFQGMLTGLSQDGQTIRLIYEGYKDGNKQEVVLDTKIFNFNPDAEGKFCGGKAGNLPQNQCPTGFRCRLDGNYPDASGKCVRE